MQTNRRVGAWIAEEVYKEFKKACVDKETDMGTVIATLVEKWVNAIDNS